MKTLIPLSEFIRKSFDKVKTSEYAVMEEYRSICLYSEFLQQPLNVNMFFPADDDGNILQRPGYYECFLNGSYLNRSQLINYENCMMYKKAEEKVLFQVNCKVGTYNDKKAIYLNGVSPQLISDFNFLTIEDIVHWNLKLTPSALHIGIKEN
jgi:hypothetical protein